MNRRLHRPLAALLAAAALWLGPGALARASEADFLPIEEEAGGRAPAPDRESDREPDRPSGGDPWRTSALQDVLDGDGVGAETHLLVAGIVFAALLAAGLLVFVVHSRREVEDERAGSLRRHEEEIAQFNRTLEGYKRSVEEKNAELERSARSVEEKAAELGRANRQMAAMMAELQRGKAEMEEKNRQLTLSQMQIADKTKKLRELSRVKSQFLANMSHELRTPMNAIIGFTDMVLKKAEGTLPDVQMKNLERVRRNAHNLLGLINDILDISKIESGKMDVDPEGFGLRGLLVGVAQGLSPLATSKGLQLEAEVPGEDVQMASDPRKIRQIVTNLISNALKFTDHGGVRVLAERMVCAVPGEDGRPREREFVQIDVRDTGIGMRPDDLKVIFEEFRQVDGSATRKHGGTGLGLAITRRLTELLGGSISVASEVGVGTVFSVRLPTVYEAPPEAEEGKERPAAPPASEPARPLRPLVAAPPPERPAEAPRPARAEPKPRTDAPAPRPAAAPAPTAPAPARRGRKVALVVHDDPDFVGRAREALQEAGFQAMSAFDPDEALEKASLIRPDLIVLNPLLAGAEGWRMLPALKRDAAARRIPVVLAASTNGSGKGAAWRFRDMLLKPVAEGDLREALSGGPAPRRVLVLDRDGRSLAALGGLLRAMGLDAALADAPESAASAWGGEPPDLVLADLGLAEAAGLRLLGAVERNERLRSVPVVALLPEEWSDEAVERLDRDARRVLAEAREDVFARLGALAREAAEEGAREDAA